MWLSQCGYSAHMIRGMRGRHAYGLLSVRLVCLFPGQPQRYAGELWDQMKKSHGIRESICFLAHHSLTSASKPALPKSSQCVFEAIQSLSIHTSTCVWWGLEVQLIALILSCCVDCLVIHTAYVKVADAIFNMDLLTWVVRFDERKQPCRQMSQMMMS